MKKTLALIALGSSGLAGCALGPADTNHIQISMPAGGLRSTGSSSSQLLNAPQNFYVLPGTYSGAASSTGGSSFTAPTNISQFSCFAVMVTGDGIFADALIVDKCAPKDAAGNPLNIGILAGFSPVSGGVIDVDIPSGPARKIRLIGIQSEGGCPLLSDMMKEDDRNSTGPKLGDPFELGSVQQDIFADQTIGIKASFTAGAQPLFSCNNDRHSGSGPLAISGLSMYPTLPTSGTQVRVSGTYSGGGDSPQFTVYTDASCTSSLSTNQWNRNGSMFSITSMNSPMTPTLYVKGTANGESSACMLVPGSYSYSASAPSVSLNSPTLFAGSQVDGASPSINVSGSCGPFSGGDVSVTLNGSAYGTPCACGGAGTYTCSPISITAVPDGPVQIKVIMTKVSGGATVDDGFMFVKDALAPGVTMTSPTGLAVGAAGSASFSGMCGGSGFAVDLYLRQPNTNGIHLGTTTCPGSSWTISGVNLTPYAVAGMSLEFYVDHAGTNGAAHTSRAHISTAFSP